MGCPVCWSHKTEQHNNVWHCRDCRVYYSGNRIVSLPFHTNVQNRLELCSSCQRADIDAVRSGRTSSIRCKSAKEYIGALKYCSKCKLQNNDILENQFYKNLLLHRKLVALFSIKQIIIYIGLTLWLENCIVDIILLMFIWIILDRPNWIVFAILAFLSINFDSFLIVRFLIMGITLVKMIMAKRVLFEIPRDPYEGTGLKDLVRKLSI